MIVTNDLAARIQLAIAGRGKTQTRIAVEAGVPEETLSRIITRNSKNPRIGTLMKLAPALRVSVGWLLGEQAVPLAPFEADAIERAIEVLRGRLRTMPVIMRPNALPEARTKRARLGDAIPQLAPVPLAAAPSLFPEAAWIVGARDDSMQRSGILPGDHLYVREVRESNAAIDSVVVCLLNGAWYVKRLTVRRREFELASEDDRSLPIQIYEHADEFFLLGVVIGRAGEIR